MHPLTFKDSGTLAFTEDLVGNIPPHAILSHFVGDDDRELEHFNVHIPFVYGEGGQNALSRLRS
jgi:hypothetical protein